MRQSGQPTGGSVCGYCPAPAQSGCAFNKTFDSWPAGSISSGQQWTPGRLPKKAESQGNIFTGRAAISGHAPHRGKSPSGFAATFGNATPYSRNFRVVKEKAIK